MHGKTLAILAGGAGSRMGGPKGSLELRGQPIVERLIEQFRWEGPTMLVTAPGIDPPRGAEFCDLVICDPVAGLGPLRGVLTAIEHVRSEVVVTTVDMPGIQRKQLLWITRQLIDRPDVHGVMSRRQMENIEQIEPFPSAYRPSALAVIQQQLIEQRRSVNGLLQLKEFIAIQSPADWPVETWANLNTPQDLAQFIAGDA